MSIVDLFNGLEVTFWFGLSLFVFWRFGRAGSTTRRLALQAAGWLLLFGVSDIIEVFTGAWWRPVGLLILKGACLCGLFYCGWREIQRCRNPAAGRR